MQKLLDRIFKLSSNNTTIGREISGGITTFLTMSYIIFVQPGILSATGMDFGAVMAITCIASALATLVMAFTANYPVALAPCLGGSFFFVMVCLGGATGTAVPWNTALAAVFVAGLLFIALTVFVKFREAIVEALPLSFRHAIAAAIGLFIALIGLQQGGLVVTHAAGAISLQQISWGPALLTLFGLFLISVLFARQVKGAILLGLLGTTVVGLLFGIVKFQGIFSLPPSIMPVFFKLNFHGLLDIAIWPVIAIFLFMVLFDALGTLTGIGEEAGLIKEGKLERVEHALFSDAIGTTLGALLGTSTVSSYIESSTGVASGARTGLSGVVVGLLFLLSLFFLPLVSMVAGGVEISQGVVLHPVTAPALIIVGAIMMRGIREIAWNDPSEVIPSFLLIASVPFFYSIADGLAFGFISYALIKLLSGKAHQVKPLVYVIALLLIGVFLLRAY